MAREAREIYIQSGSYVNYGLSMEGKRQNGEHIRCNDQFGLVIQRISAGYNLRNEALTVRFWERIILTAWLRVHSFPCSLRRA
jgi:hypothetical protein